MSHDANNGLESGVYHPSLLWNEVLGEDVPRAHTKAVRRAVRDELELNQTDAHIAGGVRQERIRQAFAFGVIASFIAIVYMREKPSLPVGEDASPEQRIVNIDIEELEAAASLAAMSETDSAIVHEFDLFDDLDVIESWEDA